MILKAVLGVILLLVTFLGYVSTRDGKFRYERSGTINAPPEAIFPYISQFKAAGAWSPYEKKDPSMKKNFIGLDGQVGSVEEFDGNREVGAGRLEFLKIVPNQSVEIRLSMTKPMRAENLVEYRLTPEGNGTRFSWIMSGDGGFMGKLISTLIDCEKMVAGDFTVGIENLKNLVENRK